MLLLRAVRVRVRAHNKKAEHAGTRHRFPAAPLPPPLACAARRKTLTAPAPV
jgi:hypothetical protein